MQKYISSISMGYTQTFSAYVFVCVFVYVRLPANKLRCVWECVCRKGRHFFFILQHWTGAGRKRGGGIKVQLLKADKNNFAH